MSAQEITSKVREIKELTRMKEELEQEIAALQDAIKAEMDARQTEEIIVDVFKVRWTSVTSNRFDTTGFKKTHKDLYEQYTKASTYKRFSIA